MFMSRKEMVASMEEIFIMLKHMQQKINHFVSLLFIFKVLKHWHHKGVFLQHHSKQRNHKSIYLTSLMGHVQSLKVFATKCV
jgi:hypothetical protein